MKRSSKTSGFSLVEMMVVAALFAFMMGVVFTAATSGSKAMDNHQARITATFEARRGLDEMARELIRAPITEIADEAGTTPWPPADSWDGIQFRYPESVDGDGEVEDWSNTITYSWDEVENQLIRTDDAGNTRVLANDVTDFSIQQGDTENEVWIQLTTETTSRSNHVMQQPLQMRIRVRNE